MAHVELLNYATPNGQKEFIDKVNSIKMHHEGPLRQGYVRPLLSEWKMFDVRVNADKMEQFAGIVRFQAASTNQPINKDNIQSNARILRWIIRFARLCLRLGTIKPDLSQPAMKMKNWRYTFLVGTVKDPIQHSGFKNDPPREVL